ncbi:head maturation protease, ClpP-related [Amorphus orientalis]|uniref:ATP-dependent Clp protease proteolytic subunit n=1 Tax=Amorphus orientalis TaxID=649198 RepID=A0AAE3VML4_9HYPH|nr:head maturation protease, ClpP-related [Amorphus orientalis]MDQ0314843.1 ATP-dependent protease ClpP protease subunit [Amorphus orientalis]
MTILRDGELILYGYVGDDFWGEGFTASAVLAALAEHGRDNDLVVRLNSGGGIIDEGVAIYNALATHKGNVRIEIDAVAASAATIIAMAGDEIVMKAGSIMMIHDPANITFGTIADHEKTIEQLSAYAAQMVSIYAERSGNSPESVRATMEAETWLTADQAVEAGYADKAEAGQAKAVAAFDFRVFAKAPDDLKALAERKNWTFKADHRAGASASGASRSKKETHMPENPKPEKTTAELEEANKQAADAAVTAYKERRKAVMSLEEATGRESLAEHLVESTELDVEAIKATLAASPKAQAEDPEPDPAAYERERLATAGQAQPGAKATAKSGLHDRITKKIEGLKPAAAG